MNNRNTAVIVGVLYIIGTVSGIVSTVLIGPILEAPENLAAIAANENQILIGTLFVLTMAFALAMVPVMLFPIFSKHNEVLALGAVVFRGALETVTYIAIGVCWLLLITVSQARAQAGSPDLSYFQSLSTTFVEANNWISQMLGIVFSLGALMIYYVFYLSKLIPRWIAIWGLIGGVLYLAASLAGLFGMEWGFLMAPLALQEMVLALWLIIKGFNPSPAAALSLALENI